MQAYNAGDFARAVSLAERALKDRKRDHNLLHLQAACLMKMGDPEAALEKLLAACRVERRDPQLLISLAQTYRALQRFEEFDATLGRVLEIAPGLADAVYLHAQSYRERGMLDDARRVIEEAMGATDAGHVDPTLLAAHAEVCLAAKDTEAGMASAEAVVARGDAVRVEVRRRATFLLGRLLDGAGRYDEAFEAFSRGNAMYTTPIRVMPAAYVRERWSAERLADVPVASERTELPVLVCGMPRTGTTLVEQMLAAHPEIGTVGECAALPAMELRCDPARLDQRAIDQMQRQYLEALAPGARGGEARVVDKMTMNYAMLGLASRVVPGLRVIYCVRDPRDVCLSCFQQDFTADAHPYSRDLTQCALQYAEHTRIMEHWRAVLPDVALMEVRYAELVEDPERVVRAMLGFVGVGFDPACLRHHETAAPVTTASSAQVREPVYRTSLARWRHYGANLDPLAQALRKAGVPLEG